MTITDPFLVEVRRRPGTIGPEWIPVMTVPLNDRTDARRWLRAQGYRWMDRRACKANPGYVREWRIVPNPSREKADA
jgi:hypothetical protein